MRNLTAKVVALSPSKESLLKELYRLQRELNGNRLGRYIIGDDSEEKKARQRERAEKLARFHKVLGQLNSLS